MKIEKLLSEYLEWGRKDAKKKNVIIKKENKFRNDKNENSEYRKKLESVEQEIREIKLEKEACYKWNIIKRIYLFNKSEKLDNEKYKCLINVTHSYLPPLMLYEFTPTTDGFLKWISDNNKL